MYIVLHGIEIKHVHYVSEFYSLAEAFEVAISILISITV